MKKSENYELNLPEPTDAYNVEHANENMVKIDTLLKEQETNHENHTKNKNNPHEVTAEQVGLGNVPNVATNNQTPTYTIATSNAALKSGEKLSVAFGKIAKAVNSLISHLANVNNPHSVTKKQVGLGNVEDKSSATIRSEITKENVTTALGFTPLDASTKGAANGVAELDKNGMVLSSQLPSYVDDVVEGDDLSSFPATGEGGKIYMAKDTGKTYRWSGTTYVEISKSLALGETSSTAYRGDRGKVAYEHSQMTTGNPHRVTKSDVGLDKVENTADADKSVKYAATAGTAESAETAEKATQDANGNIIAETYATKEEVEKIADTDKSIVISNTITGTNPTATDSTDAPIISQIINGYTVQDGTPTSDTPVEIESLGELQSDGSYKVEVRTCGKNLLGGLTLAQAIVDSGVQSTLDEIAETVTFGRINYYYPLFDNFKENTQYTFMLNGEGVTNGNVEDFVLNLAFYYTDGTLRNLYVRDLGTPIVSENGKSVESIGLINSDTDTSLLYYNECGIFEGVITADEFEPYTETTAELSLSEPLYEGDYIKYRANGSGVLHRSMCGAVFDGSDDEGWGKSATTGTNRYYVYINDIFASSDCNFLCSQAIRVNNTSTTANSVAFVTPAKQFAINTEFSTLEEWKAWLAENPMTVVYELATPTEIELTAEELEQFKNLRTFEPVTNIICDGETETTYYKATDNGEVVSALHKKVDAYVKKEEFTGFKYLKTVDLANYAELGPEYRAKVGQLGFDRYMFNLRATQTYDYSEHDVDIMNIIKPANEPVMKHIPPVMGLNSSYTSIVSFFSGVVYISDGDVEFLLSIDAGGTNPKVPSDYRVDIYGAMD